MQPQNDQWNRSSSPESPNRDTTHFLRDLQEPLTVLQEQYSLDPDMIFGWKPKLPSCPLPLSYHNHIVNQVLKALLTDDRYKIAYRGPRLINSVKVNQIFEYKWKYREKYQLQIQSIKNAVENVGKQQTIQVGTQHCQIDFDSNFESGNLDLAVRVRPSEYDCFLRSDTNTRGHTNWFYFKIKNKKLLGAVQINICNLVKVKNLYGKGMHPYTFDPQNPAAEWTQADCSDVVFLEKYCRYLPDIKHYQMQFKYTFTKEDQEIHCAYGIPYTYSHLERFIEEIELKYPHSVKKTTLCESLGGLELPLLLITNRTKSDLQKRKMLISARIHPGETNSSHIVEQIVRELAADTPQSQSLRDRFAIYVVPMLNPDGVVIGNYRTSYSGKDLNRHFKQFNKYSFPEITALNSLATNIIGKIDYYFDFHSHSSKKGFFTYGPDHPKTSEYYLKARVFSKLLEKEHELFTYRQSNFLISKKKETTARAHMLRKLRIPMSYTFEISNGLYSSNRQTLQLDLQSLKTAGTLVYNGFLAYLKLEPVFTESVRIKSKIDLRNRRLLRKHKTQLLNTFKDGASQSFVTHPFEVEDQLRQQWKSSSITNKDKMLELLNEISEEKTKYTFQSEHSDSESSEDDLPQQESESLFTFIRLRSQNEKRNVISPKVMVENRQPLTEKVIKVAKDIKSTRKMQKNITIKRKSAVLSENTLKAIQQSKSPKLFKMDLRVPMKKLFKSEQPQKRYPLVQKRFPILF